MSDVGRYKRVIRNTSMDGRNAHCNFYAQDVMKQLGTPLPTGKCKQMLDRLYGNNFRPWASVSFTEAQSRANRGKSTIAITHDHIAVVYPNNGSVPSKVGDVLIAQTGASKFIGKKLSYGWRKSRHSEIKFYSYF